MELTLIDSTVSGNTAVGVGALSGLISGGGVYLAQGSASLTNATISGNTSATGGAGVKLDTNFGPTSLILTNSTVSGNVAAAGAGGILVEMGTVTLMKNSIVGGNGGADCSGAVTSLGHNIDGDGTCGLTSLGDQPSVDPLLGPLADNGGPTQTHALLVGSPAIDMGADASAPALDQRGLPRAAVSDVGAYEFQDADEDGFEDEASAGTDCDDGDAAVFPGADEVPYDGVDQDCDGADLTDADGDGHEADAAVGGSPDCDDTDTSVFPGADEVVGDGVDQDCDGEDLVKEEEEEEEKPPEEEEEMAPEEKGPSEEQGPPEEEEPAGPGELVLRDGGQFVFWRSGAVAATAVFGTVKIAWLWNPFVRVWTSFIPVLGVVNFDVRPEDFLWVVSEGEQTIVVG